VKISFSAHLSPRRVEVSSSRNKRKKVKEGDEEEQAAAGYPKKSIEREIQAKVLALFID
jgi:hypothetical protein